MKSKKPTKNELYLELIKTLEILNEIESDLYDLYDYRDYKQKEVKRLKEKLKINTDKKGV